MKKIFAALAMVGLLLLIGVPYGEAATVEPEPEPAPGKVEAYYGYLREFRLAYRDGTFVERNSVVSIRPASVVELYLIDAVYDYNHSVLVDPEEAVAIGTDIYGNTIYRLKRTGVVSAANPSQLGGRISLYYNPNHEPYNVFFETEGLLTLTETSNPITASSTAGPIDVQLNTSYSASGIDTLYSISYPLYVFVEDDDGKGPYGVPMGDGGGTCNAVGLGSLALLLPLAFIRKRK